MQVFYFNRGYPDSALIVKIKSTDLFHQNTTTYTVISIVVWLHVSVPS